MTLRARLVLSLGILTAIALLLTGLLVVGLTRAGLVNQVDQELREAATRPVGEGGFARFAPGGRRLALVVLGPDGRLVATQPSGTAARSDPLPSWPVSTAPSEFVGHVVERPAVEGDLRYRTLVAPLRGDRFLLLAAPLDVVDAPIRQLVRNLLLIGAVALGAILFVTWLILRRGLRPLETIAVTADTIATGDLSHRADLPRDGSEVGRLGAAFNRMLDQIEGAFGQQRAALDAKDRSERRLRQFVADASHELRTPLTAVRGYAELYRAGGLAEQEALARAMSRIETESSRMAGLVDDLLLLARLDQGRPLRRESVSLSDLVRDAVGDAKAIEPDRRLSAEIADGIRVEGDEDRLRQVVGNLLANVRVHTPPATPVEVTLEVVGDAATVRIVDHGPGIAETHAGRVFDRFFRADPGRSRDRGGSGLGLSIAASVVEAHGGEVRHEPSPGGGATFVLTLPVAGPGDGGSGLHERRHPADRAVGLQAQDRPGEAGVPFGLDGQGVRDAAPGGRD